MLIRGMRILYRKLVQNGMLRHSIKAFFVFCVRVRLQNSQNKEQNLFTTFNTSIKIQKLVADFESVDKISKQFFHTVNK
jgi:hypothetical protein